MTSTPTRTHLDNLARLIAAEGGTVKFDATLLTLDNHGIPDSIRDSQGHAILSRVRLTPHEWEELARHLARKLHHND